MAETAKSSEKKAKKAKSKYSRKSDSKIRSAKKHIDLLLSAAKNVSVKPSPGPDRYVLLARKIAMKFKIRLTNSQKAVFCPHCYRYLKSEDFRVRVRRGKLIKYCLHCKKFWRKPLD